MTETYHINGLHLLYGDRKMNMNDLKLTIHIEMCKGIEKYIK